MFAHHIRTKRRADMGTRNRILSIQLMNRIRKNPEYAKQLGVDVKLVERDRSKTIKNQF